MSNARKPLVKHVDFFANNDDDHTIDRTSMVAQLKAIGDTDTHAQQVATTVAVGAHAKLFRCPFASVKSEETALALVHGQHTGIYNDDGSINEEVWAQLHNYSQQDTDGEEIITKAKFYEFLEMRRSKDPNWDVLGISRTASDGEWKQFWETCTERWVQGENGYEPAVTLKTLRAFFEDSKVVFDRVTSGELPAPCPDAASSTARCTH